MGLPERHYWTGTTALGDSVLHEMEKGRKKTSTCSRDFCQVPAENLCDGIVQAHGVSKILILF